LADPIEILIFNFYTRTDPDQLPGTRISHLLSARDRGVFRDATQRLQEDDSHTVEVRFELKIQPEYERDASLGNLYQLMEGKGMLMIDREDGKPSHTMWVVKPIAAARFEHDSFSSGEMDEDIFSSKLPDTSISGRRPSVPVTPFPFNEPFSTDLILCRICDGQIPQWYFEKHSETCVEVHRLEAEIADCNESISELRSTIRDLCSTFERSSPVIVPEYRGMPIYSPSTSPIVSSPLQLFRVNWTHRMGVKKMQRRLLDQLEEILQVAFEVSLPALKDEEPKEPIERLRLLSPDSERKMSQVRSWVQPSTQDAALGQLVQDAERVMRQKIDNVVRMQNTIRYSEKIWHEWEEKVQQSLATVSESDGSDESDDDSDDLRDRKVGGDDGDASSTSEFAFDGDVPSSEPTPMASSSLIRSSGPGNHSNSSVSSIPHPIPRKVMNTRSSTPSSVSSPLALAAPIMAPSSPKDAPPPMSLDDGPIPLTITTQKPSHSLLEPKLLITPPMSPKILSRESSRRSHRRHSTVNPILSPTSSSAPLSPRQSSVAPLSRSTPTSIKDFDVIKPIRKGAFGSVFLAKKKITGDYYAIKVLKKADMIAKNQITNVKAERMILMKQAESPFVAKLYFTFQSKENLYLVMEYLNGGDCAALIKSLGSLPEEWTKNYIAEVVLGLEYLHQRGVVHRYVVM
jgi:serine/threonine-protein kinase RIM15